MLLPTAATRCRLLRVTQRRTQEFFKRWVVRQNEKGNEIALDVIIKAFKGPAAMVNAIWKRTTSEEEGTPVYHTNGKNGSRTRQGVAVFVLDTVVKLLVHLHASALVSVENFHEDASFQRIFSDGFSLKEKRYWTAFTCAVNALRKHAQVGRIEAIHRELDQTAQQRSVATNVHSTRTQVAVHRVVSMLLTWWLTELAARRIMSPQATLVTQIVLGIIHRNDVWSSIFVQAFRDRTHGSGEMAGWSTVLSIHTLFQAATATAPAVVGAIPDFVLGLAMQKCIEGSCPGTLLAGVVAFLWAISVFVDVAYLRLSRHKSMDAFANSIIRRCDVKAWFGGRRSDRIVNAITVELGKASESVVAVGWIPMMRQKFCAYLVALFDDLALMHLATSWIGTDGKDGSEPASVNTSEVYSTWYKEILDRLIGLNGQIGESQSGFLQAENPFSRVAKILMAASRTRANDEWFATIAFAIYFAVRYTHLYVERIDGPKGGGSDILSTLFRFRLIHDHGGRSVPGSCWFKAQHARRDAVVQWMKDVRRSKTRELMDAYQRAMYTYAIVAGKSNTSNDKFRALKTALRIERRARDFPLDVYTTERGCENPDDDKAILVHIRKTCIGHILLGSNQDNVRSTSISKGLTDIDSFFQGLMEESTSAEPQTTNGTVDKEVGKFNKDKATVLFLDGCGTAVGPLDHRPRRLDRTASFWLDRTPLVTEYTKDDPYEGFLEWGVEGGGREGSPSLHSIPGAILGEDPSAVSGAWNVDDIARLGVDARLFDHARYDALDTATSEAQERDASSRLRNAILYHRKRYDQAIPAEDGAAGDDDEFVVRKRGTVQLCLTRGSPGEAAAERDTGALCSDTLRMYRHRYTFILYMLHALARSKLNLRGACARLISVVWCASDTCQDVTADVEAIYKSLVDISNPDERMTEAWKKLDRLTPSSRHPHRHYCCYAVMESRYDAATFARTPWYEYDMHEEAANKKKNKTED